MPRSRQQIAAHPEAVLPTDTANRGGQGRCSRVLVLPGPSGDMLMILDADLTVPPEDLPHASMKRSVPARENSSTVFG